jgi:hypothetical protein
MALDRLTRTKATIAWLISTLAFSSLVFVSVLGNGPLRTILGRVPPVWACVLTCLVVSAAMRFYFHHRHWR